jgi:hypothetical protein
MPNSISIPESGTLEVVKRWLIRILCLAFEAEIASKWLAYEASALSFPPLASAKLHPRKNDSVRVAFD